MGFRLFSASTIATILILAYVAFAPAVVTLDLLKDDNNLILSRGLYNDGSDSGGNGNDDGDGDRNELQNWSSLIGIVTAIVGNTLIALALNVQRYAHVRLQKRRAWAKERAKQALLRSQVEPSGYGAIENSTHNDRLPIHSGDLGAEEMRQNGRETVPENTNEHDPMSQSMRSDYSADSKDPISYLKDPYWWMGQVLITVGETGNFLAYGFAPASIVSPLGVVTLVANCVVAPIVFHERFRIRDFWGVVIAVMGVVTVVLSANQKETKLGPHEVWDAITTMEFEIYVTISMSCIILLMWLSPRYGNRTILIDLGLVGLFGAYTALSTKGVSSMLSSTLFGAFTTPVTYGLVFVLLFTAIMQIRYLNKALQRFDSTQVIPIQFVLFTLSVILGSAVLYRDFEQTTGDQALKFVGGCLFTFFGVFLITSGRPPADDEDEQLWDDEDVEETLHLSLQNSNQHPFPASLQGESERSPISVPQPQPSTKSSKLGFFEAVLRPFTTLSKEQQSIPSRRTSHVSSRASLQSNSIQDHLWHSSPEDIPNRPLIHRQPASADSILTPSNYPDSETAILLPATEPVTPHNGLVTGSYSSPAGCLPHELSSLTTIPHEGISRSYSHTMHHHTSHHVMINPSPLSSTVNAMIGDALLSEANHPMRRASVKRSRPSLRASLFVPQGEIFGEESERHPLFQVSEQLSTPNENDREIDSHRGLRGRARSLSNTFHDLFGGVRLLRRNTSPNINTLRREDN